MRSQLSVHRPRLLVLEPPHLGPQLAGCIGGLVLALVFGTATTLALSGNSLAPVIRLPWDDHREVRWFTLFLGAASCLASVLVASGFGIKLFAIVSHRLGWPPVLESEGPCRLVQDASGLWGLRMELSEHRTSGASESYGRGAASSCCLLFRLDEAGAGAVSHLTSPDEALVVRWLDLPLAVGGPALLEVRFPIRQIAADDATTEVRRAA
jgi:hypothetical protein